MITRRLSRKVPFSFVFLRLARFLQVANGLPHDPAHICTKGANGPFTIGQNRKHRNGNHKEPDNDTGVGKAYPCRKATKHPIHNKPERGNVTTYTIEVSAAKEKMSMDTLLFLLLIAGLIFWKAC